MTKQTEIIVVHESVLASYLKDLASVGSLMAAVGLGIWLDSAALQWVAGLLWIVMILLASFKSTNDKRMTLADARKRLDEIEAGLK
jgi:hypothetical protein